MGGVPKVTVLRVIEIEDGEAIAMPDTWQPDDATPPPRVRLVERKGKGQSCPRLGSRRPSARADRGNAHRLDRPSDEEAARA
jgi:ribonuclease R